MKFPRPSGKPAFNADWFLWFFGLLDLPEGVPVSVEGHHILIAREGLAPNLRELLVLIPKGNHKTTLTGAAMDWHLLTTPNANGYVGAADKIQADEMYRFMVHFVQSEPEIEQHLLVRQSTREIRSRRDQGFARVLASDDSKQGGKRQGLNATFFDLDELHAHENDNLYIDARSGLFKRNGRLWTISTAGWDPEGVLGKLRASFLSIDLQGGSVETGLRVREDGTTERHPDGRLTIARSADGRSVMLEWANREDDDLSDAAVVKLANPASTVTVESIEDAMNAPGITPWAFMRYRANRWTTTYESWIPAGSWEAMAEAGSVLEPDEPTVAALDMARYRDSAALVLLQRRSDGRKVVEALTWRPGGPDDPVPYAVVKDAIRAAADTYRLQAVGVDPKWSDQLAEELFAEGIPVETFSQQNERMCPAWAELRKDILEGAFVHDGDPVLRSHLYAGTIYEVGTDQFKVVKSKASGPDMDAADALAMANSLANQDLTSMYEDEDARI